jgi:hypothetical protein
VNKIWLFALAVASCATPAVARDKTPPFVESAAVKDKPAVVLNPAKAYILLRTDAAGPMQLMRVPSAEDQARYDRLRAEAYAEAREKYAKKQKSYERAVADAAKDPAVRVPEKPVEPTEANFEFTPFGLMAGVAIGPINRFAKGEGGASTYLHEVTPGEYRVYGPVAVGPNGMIGTCFCMGSVRFEARAGEITDMGVILSRQAPSVKAPPGDSSMPQLVNIPDYLGPAPATLPLDPRLASFTIRRAVYRPVGKLPNYFGVALGRIPEMPGVLRYDRDRIVDLTAH